MIVRKVEDKDLPEISDWFRSISWPLPGVENLMPKDQGYVAVDGNKLCACAWLYLTGTSLGLISWTNTHPKLEAEKQKEALNAVIKTIQEAATFANVKLLVVHTKNEKFAETLKKLEFRAGFGFYQATWIAKDDAI